MARCKGKNVKKGKAKSSEQTITKVVSVRSENRKRNSKEWRQKVK